jgi:hypothetical protein
MVTLPKRFEKMADPLAPVLTGRIDMAAAIDGIERRLGAESGGNDGGGTGTAGARKRKRPRPPRA